MCHVERHVKMEAAVEREKEWTYLSKIQIGPKSGPICPGLDFSFWPPELCKGNCVLFEVSQFVVTCYSCLRPLM
jgi:hypothetical protein